MSLARDYGAKSNHRITGTGGGPVRRVRPAAFKRYDGPYSMGEDGPKRRLSTGGLSNNDVHHHIIVTNLAYRVTCADIRGLFQGFGPTKTAAVRYDVFGRSQGIADVVFYSKSAALRAIRRYQNVRLDGRLMKIALATDMRTRLGRAPAVPSERVWAFRGDDARGVRGNNRRAGGHGAAGSVVRNNKKKTY